MPLQIRTTLRDNTRPKRNTRESTTGLKSSNWLITLNTNKVKTAGLMNQFKDTVDYICENIDMFFIERVPTEVLEVKNEGTFELSSKHLLHAHLIVSATHKGEIQLDYNKLRDELASRMGWRIYCNVKLFRDNKIALENYIRKRPVGPG